MRTLRELAEQFPAAPDQGLRAEQIVESRQRFGENRLTPLPRKPIWKSFLEKFNEPIIKILLAAAVLSLLTGWVTSGALLDGLAILVAVVLATSVAFVSEYRSAREFEALSAHNKTQKVKVLRDGGVHAVPLQDVVVGDAVVLEAGDEVPADGRIVKANDLLVDQSLMTGEPEPVAKQAALPDDSGEGMEHTGCLYRGTQVVGGMGEMLVAEAGDATYLGRIAHELSADEQQATQERQRIHGRLTVSRQLTPLQLKLERLAGQISKAGYAAAVAIFAALLIQGLIHGELGWSNPGATQSFKQLLDYFMYMVIIVVVAVPEGLPMSVTVSLALAMRKMTRANCLVRQLVACETIGSTTVICTDKTGTLTQNQMQVVEVVYVDSKKDGGGGMKDETANRFAQPSCPSSLIPHPSSLASLTPLEWIILNAAVNSTANLEEKEGGRVVVGNSTEGALLRWLDDAGIDYRKLRLDVELVCQVHFSSQDKQMTTVIRWGSGQVLLAKGAPERILEQSTGYLDAQGSARPWTSEARAGVEAALRMFAGRAMRTIAFGFAMSADGTTPGKKSLTYAGAVAIRDPLRPDVRDALRQCKQAGIDVKMVTGDSRETAHAIASEIGLLEHADGEILTSQELSALDDAKAKDSLPRLRVLARAKPLDKLRLVTLLQEQEEVVAVTGDGTNDAPALKRADVGLAMGRTGTEVAKQASKMILLDDAFSTVVKAVHWGRALYENIQRFLQFQLTINVSALAIAFLAPFFGVKPPFTVLQLLWINVVMDTLASIALCSEPPRAGLMRLPPKRRDENIVTRAMAWNIAWTAAFFVAAMMTLLIGMHYGRWFAGPGPDSGEVAGLTMRQASIFFTVYVAFQVWNEINCRSLTPDASGWHGLLQNRVFLGVMAIIVLLQVVIVTFGGALFHVERLGVIDWLVIGCATSPVLLFAEISRRMQRLQRRTS
jgi:Ca2+-transporting ATPase